MQPMHPSVRNELKRVYPELTDADIDRYEELTSLRVALNPATSAEDLRKIDAERDRLVRTKMRHLGAIENAFLLRARDERRPIETPPGIEIRPPTDEGKAT